MILSTPSWSVMPLEGYFGTILGALDMLGYIVPYMGDQSRNPPLLIPQQWGGHILVDGEIGGSV